LTNASGVATTQLTPVDLQTALQQAGAAGQVGASVTINGVTVIAAAYYTMGNTSISLGLNSPASANVNAYGTSTIAVSVSSNGALYTAQPITVNFSSGCQQNGTATLPATASTVNGIARVTYTVTSNACSGLDTVTATVAGATSPVTASLNVAPAAAANINFVGANPSSSAIVLPGTGGTGRTSTAILTFKVVDNAGQGMNGVTVKFENNNTSVASLAASSGQTGSDGTVSVSVNAGSVTGNFRITAKLDLDPTIFTISDSVLVSTGYPVIGSFTAAVESPGTFNFAGWDTVLTETIRVYLADASGNPVADGTPVTATTVGGAIGTSTQGGCTTVDGECTVPFKSQNPLPSDGVALLTFSTTDSTATLLQITIGMIFSTNQSVAYTPNASTPNLWDEVLTPSGTNISTSSCSGNVVVVFSDSNGNPLAAGSTIVAASTQTGVAIGALLPSSIPNQRPHLKSILGLLSGDIFDIGSSTYIQGTKITIPLTLTAGATTLACSSGGTPDAGSATFNLTVTPVNGISQVYTFTLLYPA
jgi:hypothetical protein